MGSEIALVICLFSSPADRGPNKPQRPNPTGCLPSSCFSRYPTKVRVNRRWSTLKRSDNTRCVIEGVRELDGALGNEVLQQAPIWSP